MKLYFGVKNLRSVDIIPSIELRPITILLGRNNVGKSTFLQTLPLLRQSSDVRTIGPIYWNGEFVDFGDYSTAVKYGHENEGISFYFECEDFQISKNLWFAQLYLAKEKSIIETKISQRVKLEIQLKKFGEQVIRKKTTLSIPEFNSNVEFNFSNEGIFENVTINNQNLPGKFKNWSFEFLKGRLLTPIKQLYPDSEGKILVTSDDPFGYEFVKYVAELILTETYKEISTNLLYGLVDEIIGVPNLDISYFADRARLTEQGDLKNFYEKLSANIDDSFGNLDIICKFHTALCVYDKLVAVFSNLVKNSTYIGPMRAKSKRYHAINNLDISELRVDGANLPTMLSTLEKEKLDKLSNWLQDLFGFGLYLEKRNGHISVFAKRGETYVNFADSGFGISQLIPIAVQIWWDLNLLGDYSESTKEALNIDKSQYREVTKILSIEQPELHLHPAHQAKLADLFASSVKFARNSKNFVTPVYIIETHSEALVSRLGELIESKVVSDEDVQVLVFTKESEDLNSPTTVKKINYNAKGYLEDWPHGFFRYKSC